MWYKDTATTLAKADNNGFAARHAYLIHSPTVKGTFSSRIPLKHIFGEDYDKIVYGLKHRLTFVKKTDDDAIFRGSASGAGKVSLDKILWLMPHVIPADAEKFSIYKTIESKLKLPVEYITRQCDMLSVIESTSFTRRLSKTAQKKPTFIIVGFQTAKDGDQTKNPLTFDHANLRYAYVTLNSDRYPAVKINLLFFNQKLYRVYGDTALFGVKFFGMDELINQSKIIPSDYKTLTHFSLSMPASRKKNSNPIFLISKKGKFY